MKRCYAAIVALVLGLAWSHSIAQEPPPWAYPSGLRVGVATVDEAIRALQEGNGQTLRALFAAQSRPCTNDAGLGSVACPDGQQPGTVVSVFKSGSCEAAFSPLDSPLLDDVAREMVRLPKFLFAVARDESASQPEWVVFFGGVSDSGAVEVQGIDDAALTLRVDRNGIVAVDFGCRDGVGREASRFPPDAFVLPPKSSPRAPSVGNSLQVAEAGGGVGWFVVVATAACLALGAVAAALLAMRRRAAQ